MMTMMTMMIMMMLVATWLPISLHTSTVLIFIIGPHTYHDDNDDDDSDDYDDARPNLIAN